MRSIVLLLLSYTLFISCSNSDDGLENATLPDITTEGAGTFGARINGNVYIPRASQNGLVQLPAFEADYHFDAENGYQLRIFTSNSNEGNITLTIDLFTGNIPITEGMTYALSESPYNGVDTFPNATCILNKDFGNTFLLGDFLTNEDHTGEIEILRFDIANEIISGTFFFEAADDEQVIQVTEGRFDLLFTNRTSD